MHVESLHTQTRENISNRPQRPLRSPESASRPQVKKSDDVAALHANTHVLVQSGLDHEAYVLMVRALQMDSNNYYSLQKMSEICMRLHKYEEAKKAASHAMKIKYGFETVTQLAQIYYILGDDQKALDLFIEALSVLDHESTQLFDIYKSMGNIYVRIQDFDAAQEYYDKACTLKPDSDVLFVNYGTLEIQRGDYENALSCFRDAVRTNSKNSKAWVGMAMIHDLRADFELAWANVVQAFDFDEQNKTALMLIYQWGKRDGKEDLAIPYLMKYLCEHEADEDVSLWLTHLYLSLGQYDHARMEVEKVLLFNSDHAEAREIMFVLSERRFVL